MKVRIVGGRELLRALDQLPEAVRGKVAFNALKKAAQPLVAEEKLRAPKATGQYANSIGVVVEKSESLDSATVGIGPRRGKRYPHGHVGLFLEFGTSKMSARPHLRPAWATKAQDTLSSISSSFAAAISTAARRLARRGA